jgi:homoserine dehydrogenase
MSPQSKIYVAVVGVGLVGAELVDQILAIPAQTSPFQLISLTSSKRTLFDTAGPVTPGSEWKSKLAASPDSADLDALTQKLAGLVSGTQKVVLVDNTSSDEIAARYPAWLEKKAYSGDLGLYEKIIAASKASGARYLNEATVGAGLPVISTLKELVATGDKVRFNLRVINCYVPDSIPPASRSSKLRVSSLAQ